MYCSCWDDEVGRILVVKPASCEIEAGFQARGGGRQAGGWPPHLTFFAERGAGGGGGEAGGRLDRLCACWTE